MRPLTRGEIAGAAVAALILTLYCISYSFAHGHLLLPISYDDVMYFLDGHERLETFRESGPVAAIRAYMHSPPHSPVSTGLAFTGFGLLGLHDWAPYAMNGLLVFVLVIFTLKLLDLEHRPLRWLIVVFVCTTPAAGMCVMEFRPDIPAGLFTACGVIMTISKPFSNARRSHLVGAGAWFGLALLTKPTMFPFTLFLWGCTAIAALTIDWRMEQKLPEWRRLLRALGPNFAGVVIVAIPYYAFAIRETVGYIRVVLFSKLTAGWEAPLTATQHALYYLHGPGGSWMLGRHLWVGGLAGLLGLIVALRRGSRADRLRWGALAVLTLVAYAFVSAMKVKGPMWGSAFQLLFILGVVLALRVLILAAPVSRFGWKLPAAIAGVFALLGFACFQPYNARHGSRGDALVRKAWEATNRTLETVESLQSTDSPRVFMTALGGELNQDSLRWLSAKRGLKANFVGLLEVEDLREFAAEMNRDDIVVAPEPGLVGIVAWTTSSRVVGETLRMAQENTQFRQEAKITYPDGKSLYIFRSIGFEGWKREEGFGPMEAPNLKRGRQVRALGGRAVLQADSEASGSATLVGRCRSVAAGQTMQVRVGELIVGKIDVPNGKEFVDFSFPVPTTSADKPITLEFSTWDREDAKRPTAALFQRLQLIR